MADSSNPEKIKQAKCFLLDMDGTIYLSDRLLPGAADLIAFLAEKGLRYYFLTNNSSRSKQDYVDKLNGLGLEVSPGQVFTSGEATAIYLDRHHPGVRLYLVGTPSLMDEYTRHGFILVEDAPDAVVLGFDTTLTYEKIRRLCRFIVEGKPYIATHPDINCPTEDGFIPDIGAVMALVEASTGRLPDVIVGKPNQPMVEAVLEKTGLSAGEIVMVGDRLYTDIAMSQAGITTVLVLSGETRLEEVSLSPFTPDLIVKDVGELLEMLREA